MRGFIALYAHLMIFVCIEIYLGDVDDVLLILVNEGRWNEETLV
jgi:hypothetical protein